MFPTTCVSTTHLSEPARVGDRHRMPARRPSVGGIPSRAIGLPGTTFAIFGVTPAGRLSPNPYHLSPKVTNMLVLLLSRFSRAQLCVTPQTAAHQAPPSLGFSRQEHRSGLPLPPPNPGIRPTCPAMAGRFFTTEPPGKPHRGILLGH